MANLGMNPLRAPDLTLCTLMFVLLSCCSAGAQRPTDKHAAPDSTAPWLTPLDKTYLLKLAREVLYARPPSSGDVPSNCSGGAGREVFLTVYGPAGASLKTRAAGRSLADSVTRAAVEARVDPSFATAGLGKPDAVRIKLDLLTARELLFPHPSLNLLLEMAPGLDGLAVRSADATGYVLPAEIVTRQMTGRSRLLEFACEDGGLPVDAWRSLNTEVYRIRTISFMDAACAGKDGRYLDLYRAVPLVREVPPAAASSAALAAGRWLVSSQGEDGSFPVFYEPLEDTDERRTYSVFRHAEAALALARLCGTTKDPKMLEAERRALEFLCKHIMPAEAPEAFSFVYEHIDGKLGPAALTMLVLLEHRAALGDKSRDDDIARLGLFLMYMQKEDGSFFPIYEFRKRVKREDIAYRYNPGQALLALVRLYKLSKDENVLKAALLAADYIIHQRDAALKRTEPLDDHWAAEALCELAPISMDRSHAEYCLNIAEMMRLHQLTADRTPFLDYIGASDQGTEAGNPPSVSVTASWCRAMVAARSLAQQLGAEAGDYSRSADEMVRFMLENQYTPGNSYYLPNPHRAAGGFRASFIEHQIELECVSRCLCALMAFEGK